MLESSSWRELLGQIISNPTERDRLAGEIGVRSITLTRWVNGESMPRPQNIRQLLYALPQQFRVLFLELWDGEQPGFSASLSDSSTSELAYDFIMQVLDARATTPDTLRFWTISRLVLQHALRQLDPERIGMAITVVRCMPPSRERKIRSLREGMGMGTPPWEGDLEHRAMFLGAESLAGHVVMAGRMEAIQDFSNAFIPSCGSRTTLSIRSRIQRRNSWLGNRSKRSCLPCRSTPSETTRTYKGASLWQHLIPPRVKTPISWVIVAQRWYV